ncbi:MAG: DsbA family protein [Bacteroidales bacterium]|nr:DsbA family protein [Bacteroidales bacterium]
MKKPNRLQSLITLIFIGTSFVNTSAFSFYSKHTAMNTNPAAGKIIYVYDALCGWCYGFSPVIDQLYDNFGNQLEFEVVSGGMVTGERIGPVSDMADYISKAYIDVENASGVKFGKVFIDTTLYRDDVVFSSVEPAIALSVFKTLQPQNAVKFASAIQKAIYFHGAEPALLATYADLAMDFGINRGEFLEKMSDPKSIALAEADFQRSRTLGVNGFPTTFYEDSNGNLVQLSRGFTSYEKISARLKPLLEAE